MLSAFATPTLEGPFVTLRPYQPADTTALLAITPPEVFTFFLSAPRTHDLAGLSEYLQNHAANPKSRVFVAVDPRGTILGSTAYMDIDPKNRALEIGSTWYAPQIRGGHINTACKLLLLTHAFETLDCARVTLKSDERNTVSRAAMAAIGATFEGILRKHRINSVGYVRNTAMFSVTADEWPRVKQHLLERLARKRPALAAANDPAPLVRSTLPTTVPSARVMRAAAAPAVRVATPDDLPALLPMVEKVCAYHQALDPQKFGFLPDVTERYRTWLPRRMADTQSVVLVAVNAAGEPVGMLIGEALDEIPIYTLKRYGFIHDLWVDPAARRSGAARALVREAITRFRAMGLTQIRGDTAAENHHARDLLASLGFRPAATEMLLALEG